MTILFVILVILASVILGFFVLIQNPKGGGLAGNFAGVSSQFMGVKQTNDILDRGTWIFATLIALLSLFSTFFIGGSGSAGSTDGRLKDIGTAPISQPAATPVTPANTVPISPAPAAPATDSGK